MKNHFILLIMLLILNGCGDYDPIRNKLKAAADQMETESDELSNALNEYFKAKKAWPATIDDLEDFTKNKNITFNRKIYSSMNLNTNDDGSLSLEYKTTDGGRGTMTMDEPIRK